MTLEAKDISANQGMHKINYLFCKSISSNDIFPNYGILSKYRNALKCAFVCILHRVSTQIKPRLSQERKQGLRAMLNVMIPTECIICAVHLLQCCL